MRIIPKLRKHIRTNTWCCLPISILKLRTGKATWCQVGPFTPATVEARAARLPKGYLNLLMPVIPGVDEAEIRRLWEVRGVGNRVNAAVARAKILPVVASRHPPAGAASAALCEDRL